MSRSDTVAKLQSKLSSDGVFLEVRESEGGAEASSSYAGCVPNMEDKQKSNEVQRPAYHETRKMVRSYAPKISERCGEIGLQLWDGVGAPLQKFFAWSSQRKVKEIRASPDVLQTYNSSFLCGRVPLTMRLRSALRTGMVGYIWKALEFQLAVLSGVLYVYSTYRRYVGSDWMVLIQNIISVLFVLDYILRLYSEPVRSVYILSLPGIIDLLSALPVILLTSKELGSAVKFIRLLQFIRIIRIFNCLVKFGVAGSTVTQQIILLVIATFGVVFLDAGILQWVEYDLAPEHLRHQCSHSGCITFWQSFYFVIVTISTVGYGDITPNTILGQAVAMITILVSIVVLPIQVGRIIALASRRPYGGTFQAQKVLDSRFLIISGSVKLQVIEEFLEDLYNPAHSQDLEDYPLRVVILAPFRPSFELKQILSLYQNQVEFIEGTAFHYVDLQRAGADKAAAFFLLADWDAQDTKVEDAAQIMRALTVRRFCGGQLQVIVEVLQPSTQSSVVWDDNYSGGIQVICPFRIHYRMLSRSCLIKGLYTFITNLFTFEPRVHLPAQKFMSDYLHSVHNEVYPVILPTVFHDLLFEEVAEYVFVTFNSLLFALDVPVKTEASGQTERKILLHPKGHHIQQDDVGLVIAYDLHTAYSISKLEKNASKPQYSRKFSSCLNWHFCHEQNSCKIENLKTVGTKWSSLGNHLKEPDLHVQLADKDEESMRTDLHCEQHSCDRNGENEASKADLETLLETAAEDLLAWPPSVNYGPPLSTLLEHRAGVILENLLNRTIAKVDLEKPHILVCCQGNWPSDLYYFLCGFRKPKFPKPPIVILHPKEPTYLEWGTVGIFDDLYFLKGSPLFELDLIRGDVFRAEKVAILAHEGKPIEMSGASVKDSKHHRKSACAYTSDVDNIVITANVEKLIGNRMEIVTVEMKDKSSFYFLRPHHKTYIDHPASKWDQGALYRFAPPYMAGKVASSSLLGFLLRSSFYNKNTVSIIEQLVQGGSTETMEGECLRMLEQIPVPERYVERAYSDLFLGLLCECGMLALGMYRTKGTLGSPLSYVFTNPSKDTVVYATDLIYVLL